MQSLGLSAAQIPQALLTLFSNSNPHYIVSANETVPNFTGLNSPPNYLKAKLYFGTDFQSEDIYYQITANDYNKSIPLSIQAVLEDTSKNYTGLQPWAIDVSYWSDGTLSDDSDDVQIGDSKQITGVEYVQDYATVQVADVGWIRVYQDSQ